MPKIDKVPGAFWVALIGGLSSVGTVYLVTQYPENAPAWVAAALTGCSVLVGLAKVLWPVSAAQPVAPQDAPALARGQATAPGSQPVVRVYAARPTAVKRFFF